MSTSGTISSPEARGSASAAARRFTSIGHAVADLVGVTRVSPDLWRVYRGGIPPALRERIMVAVSRANSCAGCSRVHQRWAVRAGVTDDELEALGLDDLARLDPASRAAIVYAVERSQSSFGDEPPREISEAAAMHFTDAELGEIEAVARAITLANLTVGTATALKTRLSVFG